MFHRKWHRPSRSITKRTRRLTDIQTSCMYRGLNSFGSLPIINWPKAITARVGPQKRAKSFTLGSLGRATLTLPSRLNSLSILSANPVLAPSPAAKPIHPVRMQNADQTSEPSKTLFVARITPTGNNQKVPPTCRGVGLEFMSRPIFRRTVPHGVYEAVESNARRGTLQRSILLSTGLGLNRTPSHEILFGRSANRLAWLPWVQSLRLGNI